MAGADIRSLDVSMLRTFDALLAERSVSRAAARLFLSQPAVSASLKRLREAFGDPLFTRTATGVAPTARALALAPHVQTVLLELGRLLAAGQDFNPAQSDRVFRILGSDTLSLRVLPRLCGDLADAGSGVRILWELANHSARERLLRGEADLALLPGTAPPAGLVCEALYEDHYLAVAPPGALPGGMDLDAFCAWPQVFLGYGRSVVEDTIDQLLQRQGRQRLPQVAVNSFAQMVALVAAGRHIAVLPARVAERFAGTVQAHPLPIALHRYRLYLCLPPRAQADPAVQWLQHAVRALLSPAAEPAGAGPEATNAII